MAASYAIVTGTLPIVVDAYTDFTSTGFGTPTAAIIWSGWANTTNNPANQARFSVGFWDGTDQRTIGIFDTDNMANCLCMTCSDNSYGMAIPWFTTGQESWFTISNITDGIRITLSVEDNDTSLQNYVSVLLIKGVSAKVLTFTPNSTQNGTQESASLGFAPKLLLFASIGATTEDTASGPARDLYFSFGFAMSAGTHRNIRRWSDSGAATMAYAQKFDEDRCVGKDNSWAMEITTWGSDTFTATTRDAETGSDVTFCLALGGNDLLCDVGTLTTRTSTGDTAISTTHIPDTALICLSTVTDTTRDTDSGSNGFMVGVGKGADEYSHNYVVEDAAATSNTSSAYQSSQIINLDSSAGGSRTDLCDATAVFNTLDVTLTYSAVDATARKGWYLILGQHYIPRKMYHYSNH